MSAITLINSQTGQTANGPFAVICLASLFSAAEQSFCVWKGK